MIQLQVYMDYALLIKLFISLSPGFSKKKLNYVVYSSCYLEKWSTQIRYILYDSVTFIRRRIFHCSFLCIDKYCSSFNIYSLKDIFNETSCHTNKKNAFDSHYAILMYSIETLFLGCFHCQNVLIFIILWILKYLHLFSIPK